MIAKYATACAACPEQIRPGDHIATVGRGKQSLWVHVGCRPGSAASVAPSAAAGVVEVYTDGACRGNPGPGGWAWVIADGRQDSGGESPTTNQRMEIRAALEAVRTLSDRLVVVSDSTYVVRCFRDGWWRKWRSNDWLSSTKKPVANRDLWEPLVDLVADRDDVTFRWVKGHAGDVMNERADRLAVAAAANQPTL